VSIRCGRRSPTKRRRLSRCAHLQCAYPVDGTERARLDCQKGFGKRAGKTRETAAVVAADAMSNFHGKGRRIANTRILGLRA
jgi:hypothetical protein